MCIKFGTVRINGFRVMLADIQMDILITILRSCLGEVKYIKLVFIKDEKFQTFVTTVSKILIHYMNELTLR